MNIQSFLKKYQELPYVEKRVLQLLAFSRANIHKTSFLGVINNSDLKVALGKQYTHNTLAPILDSLINQNLLEQNKQGQYNCKPTILHHVLIDAVTAEHSKENINSIINIATNNPHVAVDKLKLGLYLNNIKLFKESILERGINNHQEIIIQLSNHFAYTTIDNDWLSKLLPEIQYWFVAAKIFFYLHVSSQGKEQEISLIKEVITHNLPTWPIASDFVIDIFLDFFFLSGDLEKIVYLMNLNQKNLIKYHSILGVSEFLRANTDKALINFDITLQISKNLSKKRNVSLSGTYGICHILSLLQAGHEGNLDQIKSLLKNYGTLEVSYYKDIKTSRYSFGRIKELQDTVKYFNPSHRLSYQVLGALVGFLALSSNEVDAVLSAALRSMSHNQYHALDCFILFLVLYWTESKVTDLDKYSLDLYKKHNNALLGLASVLKKKIGHNPITNNEVITPAPPPSSSDENTPYNFDFTKIIQVKPEWERSINTLSSYFNKQGNSKSYDKRLIWLLSPTKTREMIVPIEQKRIGNNNWNKGRAISLKRLLLNQHNLDCISIHDRAVINSIEQEYGYRGGGYYINNDKALLALVNHPLVFDAVTGDHIELNKASPELIIKEDKNNYQIKLSAYSSEPTVKLQKEGENKYNVLDIAQPTLDIIKIIGYQGITVPKLAKDKVLSLLQNAASSINVRTEFDTELIDSKPGDPSIIIQLNQVDDILKLKALVRPFGGKGSYYKPGKGSVNITAQIDNIYQGATRNLPEEQNNITKLLDHCDTLSTQNAIDYEWRVDDLETSLEILHELNTYKTNHPNHPTTIEWPHGQSLFIDKEISFNNLKLNITSSNEWFTFNGEVEIQESQVIKMRDLLAQLDQSKGRFIELSDKRFIALTESFAQRLGELNIAAKSFDNSQTIHKLAAPILLEFAEKSQKVKTDSNWKTHIDKIKGSEKYDPKIPNNLQAELRPYQIEGFKWLARLSNLGFGACLADDMGLGKTVQTIALLLKQASIGPCLVVAPASVCYVWEEECKKFAPSLNCISLNNINNDRETQINNLGKMDVLICSYGILYQIEEILSTKQFQTIVLDEAQAIKNFNTKRFKIITRLKTDNKIALSGTPVENRTEELWNLFEFLNPGFLGSRQSFQTKYTKPIEIDKNIGTRNTLKRLIQPFILRRIKSKVLEELPPKIEQTIFIEPTDQEKNFYEALRRESVEKINSLNEASNAKKRFSILAEITKLRRACCDISLVDETLEMPNSKLEAFDDIINELKENNHRALVFSQYVGYLDIVRKRLDNQKITYQYLDGSSSQKQRQSNVEAFQSGEGDLFLISLKAGGVGLNLTAADYVIHLDPWWNPAVEDQASDRAHRIGQTRPVTIYRLVMKHSIEEKILKMHNDKRELAISLLSDSDKSASLNENDLLELINQSMY